MESFVSINYCQYTTTKEKQQRFLTLVNAKELSPLKNLKMGVFSLGVFLRLSEIGVFSLAIFGRFFISGVSVSLAFFPNSGSYRFLMGYVFPMLLYGKQ